MVLDANRELSKQSIEGAEVIRETLILPAAEERRSHSPHSQCSSGDKARVLRQAPQVDAAARR